jgi:hypothetical protein
MAFLTMALRRQPVATHGNGFPCLNRFRHCSIRDWLPRVAPALPHKRSIAWREALAAAEFGPLPEEPYAERQEQGQ